MLYLTIKAALSGIIIAAVSEVARRSPTLGALIVSLPLVSILGILWLWHDTSDAERCDREGVKLFTRGALHRVPADRIHRGMALPT